MTARRWHIQDSEALMAALGEIVQIPTPLVITAKQGEETRRDRQNRFAFEAYSQVAKALNDRDASAVRAESKLYIGVPIMRANSDDFLLAYDEMIRPLPYEHKLAMMVEPFDFAVTRIMTVKLMAEYITQMLSHWDAQGATAMLERYDL